MSREHVLCKSICRGVGGAKKEERAILTLSWESCMAASISSSVFITPQKEHTLKSHSLKRMGGKKATKPT